MVMSCICWNRSKIPVVSFFAGKQVINSLGDIFTAGSETTSTTMSWLFLYMALHPDVQDKVYQEIDRVIGTDRLPTLQDRSSWVFINLLKYLRSCFDSSQKFYLIPGCRSQRPVYWKLCVCPQLFRPVFSIELYKTWFFKEPSFPRTLSSFPIYTRSIMIRIFGGLIRRNFIQNDSCPRIGPKWFGMNMYSLSPVGNGKVKTVCLLLLMYTLTL